MKKLLEKALISGAIGAVKTVLPTESVIDARKSKKDHMKGLSWTEKLNYKLHDRTTWLSIGLIAYYAYTQQWGGVAGEVFPLFGFEIPLGSE